MSMSVLAFAFVCCMCTPAPADASAARSVVRLPAGEMCRGAAVVHTSPPSAPRDRFVAEDKSKHAAMSFALSAFGYAGARTIGISHDSGVVLASAGAFAIGVAKEINDRRTGRDFSLRDLVADALGVGIGALLITHIR